MGSFPETYIDPFVLWSTRHTLNFAHLQLERTVTVSNFFTICLRNVKNNVRKSRMTFYYLQVSWE